ncbi:hypothetical protein E4T66_02615 [Sinimarinibacterium sp. CAU 1509]|uniref:hypothetical protein n=1 Tax=Sinimarinibacterium sp. CAU 1509 TaxID=2562283 RepID=UPI0010AB88C3|nr:hypothetical protein [Sinimarinibacterium sp. CAU 1509]TJY65136.1 hypothetical protein E4T66_02615 [Sinimarinibacterium sp. CAU 1509]
MIGHLASNTFSLFRIAEAPPRAAQGSRVSSDASDREWRGISQRMLRQEGKDLVGEAFGLFALHEVPP